MSSEAFLELCLGHFVVRLDLMRILQRVSDHVQTILAQAWLSSIAIFLIGLIEVRNGPRRDILEPKLVTVHIRIGPEGSIRISRGPSHDDLGPAEVLPV